MGGQTKLVRLQKEERLKGKAPYVAEVGILGVSFGAACIWGLWPMVSIAEVVGEKEQAGSWMAAVRGKRRKSNSRRSYNKKSKPEPPFACTTTSLGKYILTSIPPAADLMHLMEVSIVHADAAM